MNAHKNHTHSRGKRILALSGFGACLLALLAFKTFSGSPVWPKNGAFHYVATLDPATFPAKSVKESEALFGLADWRDAQGTSFYPGYNRKTIGWGKHSDGYNTWIWLNSSDAGLLGMTSVWWKGKALIDCDIFFNSNPKIHWYYKLLDPTASQPWASTDFRTVARHETGHAIGLDHENGALAAMNSYYTHCSLPYQANTGMMPHADDKHGVRTLYPSSTIVHNMMATCWAGTPANQGSSALRKVSGSYKGGSKITVPFTIENQGNISEPGGPNGFQGALYLSTNRVFSIYDYKLVGFTWTNTFYKHVTWSGSLTVTLPKTVPPGKYYIGVVTDSTGIIKEQFETDNDAELGQITLSQDPDLIITSVRPTATTAVRGAPFLADVTVKNQGAGAAAASAVDLYLSYVKAWPFAGRDYKVGTASVAALGAGQARTVRMSCRMPSTLCGERLYSLAAYADARWQVTETNETNQVGYGQITCKWPTSSKGQWLAGTVRGTIDSVGSLTRFPVCTKYTGTLPHNTWFLWLWGMSGSNPGIPVPGIGRMALNYDTLTSISFGLHGGVFQSMLGVQPWSTQGSLGYVQGGSWLKPLWGVKTNLAVLWFTPGKNFLAVSQQPLEMFVRKPL